MWFCFYLSRGEEIYSEKDLHAGFGDHDDVYVSEVNNVSFLESSVVCQISVIEKERHLMGQSHHYFIIQNAHDQQCDCQ